MYIQDVNKAIHEFGVAHEDFRPYVICSNIYGMYYIIYARHSKEDNATEFKMEDIGGYFTALYYKWKLRHKLILK